MSPRCGSENQYAVLSPIILSPIWIVLSMEPDGTFAFIIITLFTTKAITTAITKILTQLKISLTRLNSCWSFLFFLPFFLVSLFWLLESSDLAVSSPDVSVLSKASPFSKLFSELFSVVLFSESYTELFSSVISLLLILSLFIFIPFFWLSPLVLV